MQLLSSRDTDRTDSNVIEFAHFLFLVNKSLQELKGKHKLKETKTADNTLVIFLSDNGIPFPGAKTTLYAAGNAGLLEFSRNPASGLLTFIAAANTTATTAVAPRETAAGT
jgi:hypothetical protein